MQKHAIHTIFFPTLYSVRKQIARVFGGVNQAIFRFSPLEVPLLLNKNRDILYIYDFLPEVSLQ